MAILTRKGRALGSREYLVAESAAKTWKSFARIALRSAGVVTALSDLNWSGGRSLPGCSFNPDRPSLVPFRVQSADNLPSFREGARYFFGLRPRLNRRRRSNYFPAVFPVPQILLLEPVLTNRLTQSIGSVHKAAHTNIHDHPQRQEHEQHGRPTITH